MALSDHTFDQRGFTIRNARADVPVRKMTQFRVHLADGSKHDVLAETATHANKHVEKRFPRIKITKTKVIREQVPA